MSLTDSHPREWMTTEEWADYTMAQTTVYQLAVLGTLLTFIGIGWAMASMDGFIVETANGVMFADGGLGPGFIYGPLMAVIGTTLLSVALMFREEAKRVLSSAHFRRARSQAAALFISTVAAAVFKVLETAAQAGDDR